MKNLFYILFLSCFLACDSEHANDCFQKAGHIVKQEIVLDGFDKILVNRNVELIITEGATQNVIIETGANLLNDVIAEVVDGRLILTDGNSCNYIRDYGITKVYVTAPNIKEIRSSTQHDISSNGVLSYPSLTVLSEDFNRVGSFNIGDFRLQINNTNLSVVFNNISVAYISGVTEKLSVTFAAGTSRFEGRNLLAQKVFVNNRGSNDIILNPQQEIKGIISGIGDVICYTKPLLVDVVEVYRGRVIFR